MDDRPAPTVTQGLDTRERPVPLTLTPGGHRTALSVSRHQPLRVAAPTRGIADLRRP